MYSAYRRGRVDTALNTGSYILLAFPALVAVIAIVSFWGHSLWKITLIIGVFGAPLIFRIVRAATLSYATRDFVLAAKALGASDRRILAREILPNIMPTIISFSLIAVATIIVLEGTLAFLGLSVSPPTPSWGNMLYEGSTLLTGSKGQTNPWLVIFPAERDVPLAHQPERGGGQAPGLLRRDGDQAVSGRRTILEVEDLHVSFATSRGQLQAVHGVSFTLDQGKTLGIVGESGSGKTVLSRSIMGLLPLLGHPDGVGPLQRRTSSRRRATNSRLWGTHIAMVFQDPMTSLNPVQRIGRQITEPLRVHLGSRPRRPRRRRSRLLMPVGIPLPVARLRRLPGPTLAAACASG